MIYPQEIEVWYILPAIRKELTKNLLKLGLTQKEVALKLGVTEAAISQYLKEKRANTIIFDNTINKAAERAAKRISIKGNVMKEITKLNYLMKKKQVYLQSPS